MIGLLVLVVGAVIGSTIGAFMYRRDNIKSFIFERSKCEVCGSVIKFYDNIPIISYLVLKGKCRECKNNISLWIFIYELVGVISFFLVYIKYGISLNLIIRFMELIFLLLILFTDFKLKMVYVIDIFFLFFVEVVYKFVNNENIIISLKYMLVLGIVYLLIYLITRAMGEADIILGAVSGFFCSDYLMAFNIFKNAFVVGAIFSIIMIILQIKKKEDEIAFCPYIAISIFLSII